jgi:hypothetical protein
MNEELLRKSAEVINIYTDFMDSFVVDDIADYKKKIDIKRFIVNLIIDKNGEIFIKKRKDKNGNYQFTGLSRRIYDSLIWIKENMDIWDIEEQPFETEHECIKMIVKRKDYEKN